MRTSIFALLLLIVALTEIDGQTRDRRIGIVNSDDAGPCLAIQDANLKAGQKIVVVLPDAPQSTFNTSIKEKLDKNCSSPNDVFEKTSFYRLEDTKNVSLSLGFGFVGIEARTAKGLVTADINGDSKPDHFRLCTSSEGFHLTIWNGKPLIGKRIFHAYYYVPYDTEPSCKRKDYETPK